MNLTDVAGYKWHDANLNHSHAYLMPAVLKVLDGLGLSPERRRLFDLGCGNGAASNVLARHGWQVVGVDPSTDGIARAREAFPDLDLAPGSAYDDLAARFGRFPVVVSLEVIEHLYFPHQFAARVYELLEDDGLAIISTPYHGFWKNLALSLTNHWDEHHMSLVDHNHIKFFSVATLRRLLGQAGFRDISFLRVGRIPTLAKSMIALARR
jgi:2-polyprenyl-3-methyl-5-hydroxy-6-metoxy-1,4-benzoquinol methylase